MATDSAVRSVTNTLTTTVADTVTLTQAWPSVDVTNHSTDTAMYIRYDGTTAVGGADGTTVILAGQSKVIQGGLTGAGTIVISVVGSGNTYTIEGVN